MKILGVDSFNAPVWWLPMVLVRQGVICHIKRDPYHDGNLLYGDVEDRQFEQLACGNRKNKVDSKLMA